MIWKVLKLICIIGTLFYGCTQKDIPVQQDRALDGEELKPGIIRENSVVFLVLPQNEYDALSDEEKPQYIEVISDFAAYVYQTKDILLQNGLKPINAQSKILIFKYDNGKEVRLNFDTKKYPVAFALFAKGKKPKIYYGIVLSEDILKAASEYLGKDLTAK